jgi:hypothetical protein
VESMDLFGASIGAISALEAATIKAAEAKINLADAEANVKHLEAMVRTSDQVTGTNEKAREASVTLILDTMAAYGVALEAVKDCKRTVAVAEAAEERARNMVRLYRAMIERSVL